MIFPVVSGSRLIVSVIGYGAPILLLTIMLVQSEYLVKENTIYTLLDGNNNTLDLFNGAL